MHGERLCDYDDRGRNRFGVGARRSISSRIMVKRDDFDREVNTQSTMLSGYGGSKGRLVDVVVAGDKHCLIMMEVKVESEMQLVLAMKVGFMTRA